MLTIERTGASRAAELARHRAEAQAQINDLVAALRARFITPLPGQDGVYLSKESEARAYLSGPEPADLEGFPFLAAEVGITAPTAADLAQLWLDMAAALRVMAPQIEAARLGAARLLAEATTPAEVAQVVADLEQSLAALAP